MKKIAIFGGSFDPVHVGHYSLYRQIKRTINPDKFIIVPSRVAPLKSHKLIASEQDRYHMLRLMFKKNRDVQISTYELEQPKNKISYTIDTIEHFKRLYKNDQLYLIVGTDRYDDFKQWKDWQKILQLCKLVVVKRENVDSRIQKYVSAKFIDMKLVLASSTNLRSKPNVKYLTPTIANYIASHGLYLEQQVKPLMSRKRYAHTIRVNKLAMEFATSIDKELIVPTHIAAMCHDIGKEFKDHQLLKLVGKYDHQRFPTIHTLHGLASSIYVRKYLNINVKLILDAIANHVIPSKHPTTLDMILYCADKLEPARTKADVNDRLSYIKLVKHNLKQAFTKLQQETLKHYL